MTTDPDRKLPAPADGDTATTARRDGAPATSAGAETAAPTTAPVGAAPTTERAADVLEHNVGSLLLSAGDPPRLDDAARRRIRAHLVAEVEARAPRARRRWPLAIAAATALATAGVAAVAWRSTSGPSASGERGRGTHQLADGTTVEIAPGAKLAVLGPRHVRVAGEVVLDVAPGKGRFIVETSQGAVEALGTRFWVDASAERTLAAVMRGRVALRAAKAGAELVLGAGEGGRLERGGQPTRQPVPRLSHLTSWVKALREEREPVGPSASRGSLYARDPNFPGAEEHPLPMTQLTVDVVVDHRVARVAIDHTFHNPQDAVLEGMYRFSVPPEAALQRLAMYVDGRLMEAAVVERMRARRVYEDLVLRRVDPALLEYSGVGKLQLRVYPLAPRQDKRIALAYTQALPMLYDTWSLTVPLPRPDAPVDDVRLAVHLRGCANCEVSSPSHQVTVTPKGEDLELTYQAQRAEVGDSLHLTVRERKPGPSVARYRDGAEQYVLIRAPGALPAAAPAAPAARSRRHWVILHDTSASRGPLELRAQSQAIGALLRELDEDDQVAVLAFDVAPRQLLPFTRVLDVDAAKLATALRADEGGGVGATDVGRALDAALEAARQVGAQAPMIVYLGDGVLTAGERKLDGLRAKVAGQATFVGVGIGDGIDTQTLGALATATGGAAAAIDLSEDLRWRVFDLVAALRTPRANGLAATLVDLAGRPVPGALLRARQLADGEELEVVARIPASVELAALEVTGQVGGAPWQQRVDLAAAATATGDTGYVPRLWAQREIDRLLAAKHEPVEAPSCASPPCAGAAELRERRDEDLRKQIVELGKRYFLLSRHTSLLVLENDEMYARYGVAKGQGQTWAPYPLPARLPPRASTTSSTSSSAAPLVVATGAELVRERWQSFGQPPELLADLLPPVGGGGGGWRYRGLGGPPRETRRQVADRTDPVIADTDLQLGARLGLDSGTERSGTKGGEFMSATASDKTAPATDEDAGAASSAAQAGAGSASASTELNKSAPDLEPPPAPVVPVTSQPAGEAPAVSRRASTGMGRSGYAASYAYGGNFDWPRALDGLPYRTRQSPEQPLIEDLGALVPALADDELTRARRTLEALAPLAPTGPGAEPGVVDPGAAELLRRARAALPLGTYYWADLEASVDASRGLTWRRTFSTGLEELGRFDGEHVLRQYPELDVAVSSSLGSGDDLAVPFGLFPLLPAPADSYARRFDVKLTSAGEVALVPRRSTAGGPPPPSLLLSFDQARLRRVRDSYGRTLLDIEWSGDRPVAATARERRLEVRFAAPGTAGASGDAVARRLDQASSVVVRLPLRPVATRRQELAATAPGTPAWRHAAHQLLASAAAAGERATTADTLRALAGAGRPSPGELALGSLGASALTIDERARMTAGDSAVARYLAFAAARAPRGRRGARELRWSAAPELPGALGAMLGYLQASELAAAGEGERAISRAQALPEGAALWRALLIDEVWPLAVSGRLTPERLQWLWAALGPEYKNQSRLQLAWAQLQRWPQRAEGKATLADALTRLDLTAAPVALDGAAYAFERGATTLPWTTVNERWAQLVLGGTSLRHVVALARAQRYDDGATFNAALRRGIELAGDDQRAVAELAQLALDRNMAPWAWMMLGPRLDDAALWPPLARLASQAAAMTSQPDEALRALELARANERAARERAPESAADYAAMLAFAQERALRSYGPARQEAISKLTQIATQWRELDPSGLADRALAQAYLALGEVDPALRLLSSAIDRDPMSGQAWGELAAQLQAAGKLEVALGYWHEAVILDQTNPTWRLRYAEALLALGKNAEARAVLEEVQRRRWHVRWEWELYSVRELLRQARAK